jgi:DNA-binding transcriptional LysR family regulator
VSPQAAHCPREDFDVILDYLEVFHKVAALLLRPNTLTSLNQLAKRLRLPDDQVTRAMARLTARFQCELVVKHNRRLVLTEHGERIARIADQLFTAATTDCEAPEVLAFDVEPALAETVLPPALTDFLSAWGGLVAVRIGRPDSDPAVLRERLANGTVSFGLGFSDGETSASTEILAPSFPWVGLLPSTHPLGGAENGLPPELLAKADRVFVPGDERSLAVLSDVLHAIPSVRRIECESASAVRAMVAAGLGIGLDLDLGQISAAQPDGLRRVSLQGVRPEQIALFLPRKADTLSEAALSLVSAIKRVVTAPPEPQREPTPVADEPSANAELVSA